MNKESLINCLQNNLTVIESYGLTSLALFGSFARNDANNAIDVDLL